MGGETVSQAGKVRRISLIVATVERVEEVRVLLQSLTLQRETDFEVIIVDQNADGRLDALIGHYSCAMPIKHLRTVSAGVCRARNLGCRQASGEWLVFPDDDCWYPADFLEKARGLIERHGCDFYSGRPTNAAGETIMGTFAPSSGPIVRANVWTTLIEWMLVVRKPTFEAVGGFDELLGPGARTPWGAYEIQDLVLKCLKVGARGFYDPTFIGHHPDDRSDQTSPQAMEKMRRYSAGIGYVMRKHGYSSAEFLPRLMRPLVGIGVHALAGRTAMARRSSQIFLGRLSGWHTRTLPQEKGKAEQSIVA